MVRVLIAAVLGAVLSYTWLNVSWMILKLHEDTLNPYANPEEVAEVIRKNADKHGVYSLPHYSGGGEAEMNAVMEAAAKGPYAVGVVRPGPKEGYSMASAMIGGGVIQLVGALIIAILLSAAASRLKYLGRVMYCALIGLFAGLVSHVGNWNWFEYPFDYTFMMVIDLVIAWGLAGLIMGAIITGRSAPASSE